MDYREKTPRKNKIQSESTKSKKQHSSLGRWDRRVDENLKLNHIDPFRGTDSFVTYSCGDNLSATTKHSSLTCENIQQETDSKKTPNWSILIAYSKIMLLSFILSDIFFFNKKNM